MAGKKKKKDSGGWFWRILFLAALGVFCFSAFQLYTIYQGYQTGVKEYRAVAAEAVTRSEELPEVKDSRSDGTGDPQDTELPDYQPPRVDFARLQEENPDVTGWLEIEGIPSISYPIVQGRDNDYYLHRTFQRTENAAGSVFMDCSNAGDFSDCNTIIYGHNMKNGSMFGTLSQLYEKERYKTSRYLWVCTPVGNYRYEIISLQYTPVSSEVYTLFGAHDEQFGAYLQRMLGNSLADMQIRDLSGEDKILTLSTCTSDDHVRFVVQARWIATYE